MCQEHTDIRKNFHVNQTQLYCVLEYIHSGAHHPLLHVQSQKIFTEFAIFHFNRLFLYMHTVRWD